MSWFSVSVKCFWGVDGENSREVTGEKMDTEEEMLESWKEVDTGQGKVSEGRVGEGKVEGQRFIFGELLTSQVCSLDNVAPPLTNQYNNLTESQSATGFANNRFGI